MILYVPPWPWFELLLTDCRAIAVNAPAVQDGCCMYNITLTGHAVDIGRNVNVLTMMWYYIAAIYWIAWSIWSISFVCVHCIFLYCFCSDMHSYTYFCNMPSYIYRCFILHVTQIHVSHTILVYSSSFLIKILIRNFSPTHLDLLLRKHSGCNMIKYSRFHSPFQLLVTPNFSKILPKEYLVLATMRIYIYTCVWPFD